MHFDRRRWNRYLAKLRKRVVSAGSAYEACSTSHQSGSLFALRTIFSNCFATESLTPTLTPSDPQEGNAAAALHLTSHSTGAALRASARLHLERALATFCLNSGAVSLRHTARLSRRWPGNLPITPFQKQLDKDSAVS